MPASEILWSHVELSGFTVTSSTIEGADGIRQVYSDISKFMFSIDLIDAEGGRLGLDSCELYDEAIELAEEARADFDLNSPVRDLVVGDH